MYNRIYFSLLHFKMKNIKIYFDEISHRRDSLYDSLQGLNQFKKRVKSPKKKTEEQSFQSFTTHVETIDGDSFEGARIHRYLPISTG